MKAEYVPAGRAPTWFAASTPGLVAELLMSIVAECGPALVPARVTE
jgi:hypothetical protein